MNFCNSFFHLFGGINNSAWVLLFKWFKMTSQGPLAAGNLYTLFLNFSLVNSLLTSPTNKQKPGILFFFFVQSTINPCPRSGNAMPLLQIFFSRTTYSLSVHPMSLLGPEDPVLRVQFGYAGWGVQICLHQQCGAELGMGRIGPRRGVNSQGPGLGQHLWYLCGSKKSENVTFKPDAPGL